MPEPADEPNAGETDVKRHAPSTMPAHDMKEAGTAKRGRMLLPYYVANLAAVYLPALLPLGIQVHRHLDDEVGVNARELAIDVLAAPWAGLRFVVTRGVNAFSETLGTIGSLYVFLLSLWVGVLLLSMLYCNDARRHRLTFVLFVLSTVQAIFVAERFVAEHHQPPPEKLPAGAPD